LDLVFQHLELIEKDYFGLQYAENGQVSTTSPNLDVMVRFQSLISDKLLRYLQKSNIMIMLTEMARSFKIS
jgi:hypothetical protein